MTAPSVEQQDGMRFCHKCSVVRPLEHFSKDRNKLHGRSYVCAECRRAQQRVSKARLYRNSAAERDRVRMKARSVKDPEHVRAKNAVNNAIAHGLLTRGPCADCGATDKTQGHHEDYSKPLEVVWLCRSCHAIRHHKQLPTIQAAATDPKGSA